MGDAYLQRPEADASRIAAPEAGHAPVAPESQLGQAGELGGGQAGPVTAAEGQAHELAPVDPGGDAGGAPAAPTPEPAGGGDVYTVVRGDSLAKISRQHYQAGGLWRAVYQANEATIGRNPHLIQVGMQLSLPTLDDIIATCNHRGTVERAFEERWGVSVTRQAGATRMPVDTFRRVHAQLLLLPPDQVEGTWTKLVHVNNSRGAYMSHDGEFGLGEDAAGVESGKYGGATLSLMDDAPTGSTEIHLAATSLIGPGVQITLGTGDIAETVTIKAVSGDRTTFTIDPALTHAHELGDAVVQTQNQEREIQWLEAAVRHEMGHAVDNRMGSVTGLTEDLGGWHSTTDFDTWAGLMGNPWATADG
ncbi:MAG: LysM peptidoglycan-binding domain-containing protein, partial [bacterium]